MRHPPMKKKRLVVTKRSERTDTSPLEAAAAMATC